MGRVAWVAGGVGGTAKRGGRRGGILRAFCPHSPYPNPNSPLSFSLVFSLSPLSRHHPLPLGDFVNAQMDNAKQGWHGGFVFFFGVFPLLPTSVRLIHPPPHPDAQGGWDGGFCVNKLFPLMEIRRKAKKEKLVKTKGRTDKRGGACFEKLGRGGKKELWHEKNKGVREEEINNRMVLWINDVVNGIL